MKPDPREGRGLRPTGEPAARVMLEPAMPMNFRPIATRSTFVA